MHTFTSGVSTIITPPRPGVQTHILRARDYGDGYTLRALIARADEAGDTWLAFTNLMPRDTHHVYVPNSEVTIFVRGVHCDLLTYDRDRNSVWFG